MPADPSTVSLTTLRVWSQLGPWVAQDAAQGYPLLTLVDSWGSQHDQTEQITRDTPTHIGWGVILDADACPVAYLPYLAQFAGARIPVGTDEPTSRALIKAARSSNRGRPSSFAAIAAAFLTGTKRVDMFERDGGNAYALRIRTYQVETPAGAQPLITAALRANKPAGIILTVEVAAGPTIAQLVGTIAEQNPAPSGRISDYANILPG